MGGLKGCGFFFFFRMVCFNLWMKLLIILSIEKELMINDNGLLMDDVESEGNNRLV